MAWRTVVITSAASIKLSNDQLSITRESTVCIPVEDIGVLVIESQEVTITAPILCRLAESGTVVLICDRKHIPVFAGVPYIGHSRLSGIHRMQLDTSIPFRKRCWQAVIRQKLRNQGACLDYCGNADGAVIAVLAEQVQSGDVKNVEARGAKNYFHLLYGSGFLRGRGEYINSALDYGYAIVRGGVVRALAAHGFLLTQGIHHHSELNPFNLADDFIEPFRPVIDLMVAGMNFDEGFTSQHRAELVGALSVDVIIDNSRHCVLNAAEMTAASFVTACRSSDSGVLKLPCLIPIAEHSYE